MSELELGTRALPSHRVDGLALDCVAMLVVSKHETAAPGPARRRGSRGFVSMCCASTSVPPDVTHLFGCPKHHPAGGKAVGLRREEAAPWSGLLQQSPPALKHVESEVSSFVKLARARVLVVPMAVVDRDPHLGRIAVVQAVGTAVVLVPPEVLRVIDVRIVIETFPVLRRSRSFPTTGRKPVGLGPRLADASAASAATRKSARLNRRVIESLPSSGITLRQPSGRR